MALTTTQILALKSLKGCGNSTLRKILSETDGETVRDCELGELLRDLMGSRKVTRIQMQDIDDMDRVVRRAAATLHRSADLGIGCLTLCDSAYPEMLRSAVNEKGAPDVPAVLFYLGDINVASKPGLAVIGTREPSAAGVRAGRMLAAAAAEMGFNVVSGLALGCDASAHEGALSVKGATTAILANGLDTVFPAENEGLARRILDNGGLLLSENPIGTQASRYSLVSRDRLQAALARGTLVIQSGVSGGTMHAVGCTLSSGKGLYAVQYKGAEMDLQCCGGNRMLIAEGKATAMTSENHRTLMAGLLESTAPEEGRLF